MTIRFGTDGWRAVLGKDFTPENVGAVAQAFADLYPNLPERGRPVIIGYDRRNQSPEMARLIAQVLVGNEIPVLLSPAFCPTPCVSWMVKHKQAAAGIMVTASHNPPDWNGIKFKESYGGAASREWLAPIEALIDKNFAQKKQPRLGSLTGNKLFSFFDPHGEYLSALKKIVDLEAIRKSGFKVLHDPMYGCGSGFFDKILGDQVTVMRGEADANFGGIHPEPIRPYVDAAMQKMADGGFSICIIHDGDADRIGCVDEKGNYVTTHEIFSLLLKHVAEHKKGKGGVIKSISTTVMIDRLCKKYGFPLQVTPVGFKAISPAMKDGNILIGGEESGGIGMPSHICERDGLFCGLLLLEMMAVRGKTIGELVADLQNEVGPTFYQRIDLKLSPEKIAAVREKLPSFLPTNLAGKKVVKRNTLDGYHFALENEAWLLIRPSGTEPLLRTYAEAATTAEVQKLLGTAKEWVDGE